MQCSHRRRLESGYLLHGIRLAMAAGWAATLRPHVLSLASAIGMDSSSSAPNGLAASTWAGIRTHELSSSSLVPPWWSRPRVLMPPRLPLDQASSDSLARRDPLLAHPQLPACSQASASWWQALGPRAARPQALGAQALGAQALGRPMPWELASPAELTAPSRALARVSQHLAFEGAASAWKLVVPRPLGWRGTWRPGSPRTCPRPLQTTEWCPTHQDRR